MNFEQYRQPWESDEHWVFRKEFIKTHRERFPNEDRLLCLAQVFANIELLGCSYPEPVMAQINELSREIQQVQKLRDKRSERTVVKFVKDTSEGASRYSGSKRSASFDNKEAKKTTAQQNSRDYPSVGSVNRVGAADLFDSKPSGDPVASYYTVKGASQSRHQGEKPLPPSLVSYNTNKFVTFNENIGNYGNEGERVSSSSEPMIVDCSPKNEKSKQVDDVKIEQVLSYKTVNTQKVESKDTIKTAEPRTTPNINKIIPKPLESIFSKLSFAKLELEKKCKDTNKLHFLEILLSKCGLNRDYIYEELQQKNKQFKFVASLKIENVLCGKGAGNSKRKSRLTACSRALSLLSLNEFKIIPVEEGKPDLKLVASTDRNFKPENSLDPFHPRTLTSVISSPEPMIVDCSPEPIIVDCSPEPIIVDCSPESEKSSQANLGGDIEVPNLDTAQTQEVESNVANKKKTQSIKPAISTKYYPKPFESTFTKLAVLKLELGMKHKDTNELHFLDILLSKSGFKRRYKYQQLQPNNTKFKFIATLNIEDVLCGKAGGETRKESQLIACRRALSLLSLKEFKVIPIEEGTPDLKLVSSNDPNFSAEKCLEPFHPNIFTPVVRLGKKAANSLPSYQTNPRHDTNQGTLLGQTSKPPTNIKGKTLKFQQVSMPGMNIQGQTLKIKPQLARPGMNFQGQTAKFQQRGVQRSITPQVTTAQIILIDDTLVNPGSNDISMLMNACTFSRTPITFNFEDVKINEQPMKRCTVIISGQTEGIGDSETKQLSKSIASKAAIKNLQRRFYTIQIKQNISSSAPQISKHQVVSGKAGTSSGDTAIDSSNVGFRMMQMMGWKGKGIGKGEKGIETPVSVQDVYQREGLGFTNDGSMSSQFKRKIQQIVSQFAKSNFSDDIKFSPDFTKEERKYIHSLADKYHLKTASKGGKASGRYLVLSHKLNPQQLLHNLLTTGGSNEKYNLILPDKALITN